MKSEKYEIQIITRLNIQKVQRFSFENAHGLRIFQINSKPLSDLS